MGKTYIQTKQLLFLGIATLNGKSVAQHPKLWVLKVVSVPEWMVSDASRGKKSPAFLLFSYVTRACNPASKTSCAVFAAFLFAAVVFANCVVQNSSYDLCPYLDCRTGVMPSRCQCRSNPALEHEMFMVVTGRDGLHQCGCAYTSMQVEFSSQHFIN